MIKNAKDIQINGWSSLPQVSEALDGWFQTLTFQLVTKSLVDYEIKEVLQPIITKGVRQPFTAQQLAIKPEGQRGWLWETLHCLPNVQLKIDDIVIFNGVRYRVMQKWNWQEYGYCEYHICQGFENGIS